MAPLYEYQKKAVNDIFEAFKFHPSAMLQMPTGTGKTHVFSEIVRQQIADKETQKRVLVLAHRNELIQQIRSSLITFGVSPGLISAGSKKNVENQVQVISIPTLIRRNKDEWPKNVSLIIFDEAHHTIANSYFRIIEHYQELGAKLLGVTATPIRLDGGGFRGIFDILISSWTIRAFIDHEDKYLATYKHLATSSSSLDLSNIRINPLKKDYDEEQLGKKMSEEKVMSEIIETYKMYGDNKQAIVFAVNQKHSKNIVERFINVGLNAAYIDSKTDSVERNKILEAFKNQEIKVLSNVEIFTEGFDCPNIGAVQLARPTKSLVLYLQMVGRALRKKEDNSSAIILDNGKLWKEHGCVSKERVWTLDGEIVKNDKIAIRLETGEVVERDITEVSGLPMEEVENVYQNELNGYNEFKVVLFSSQQIIHEEILKLSSLSGIPEYIKNKISDIKENQKPDEYLIERPGVLIKSVVGVRQNAKAWVNDQFTIELKQEGSQVITLNRGLSDASLEEIEDIFKKKFGINCENIRWNNEEQHIRENQVYMHECFSQVFEKFAIELNQYLYNKEQYFKNKLLGIIISTEPDPQKELNNLDRTKDFTWSFCSPYFKVDFDDIYPIKDIEGYYKKKRITNFYNDIGSPLEILKKVNKKAWFLFFQIYDLMSLLECKLDHG